VRFLPLAVVLLEAVVWSVEPLEAVLAVVLAVVLEAAPGVAPGVAEEEVPVVAAEEVLVAAEEVLVAAEEEVLVPDQGARVGVPVAEVVLPHPDPPQDMCPRRGGQGESRHTGDHKDSLHRRHRYRSSLDLRVPDRQIRLVQTQRWVSGYLTGTA
jgi:hypothetical protein